MTGWALGEISKLSYFVVYVSDLGTGIFTFRIFKALGVYC
jgi:hypothetical protein